MKMFCICRSTDIATGLRLSGIDTLLVSNNTTNEIKEIINELYNDKSIGILGITEDVYDDLKNDVEKLALKQDLPLVIKIPNTKRILR